MSKCTVPVFVHVPKTAGTTFRAAAEQFLGAESILWDYGPVAPETTAVVRRYLYQEKDLKLLKQAVSQYKFISGHFNSMKWKRILPDCRLFTFLRDPVQRVASLFNHIGTHVDPTLKDMSLYDWVKGKHSPQADNHQVRIIGSLNAPFGKLGQADCDLAKRIVDQEFELVGITERFDESFLMIRERLGWDGLFYVSKNTLRPSVDKGYELDARTVDLIRETNRWDIQLYEHALRRLDERIAESGEALQLRLKQFKQDNARYQQELSSVQQGSGIAGNMTAPGNKGGAPGNPQVKRDPRYRGMLQLVNTDRIAGWVMHVNGPTHPVNVELLINGTVVKTTTADLMRKGVKERQIHPTGLCGFAFKLGEAEYLKEGDVVSVRVKGSKALVGGEPQVFSAQRAA